jgi:hypothetical protein
VCWTHAQTTQQMWKCMHGVNAWCTVCVRGILVVSHALQRACTSTRHDVNMQILMYSTHSTPQHACLLGFSQAGPSTPSEAGTVDDTDTSTPGAPATGASQKVVSLSSSLNSELHLFAFVSHIWSESYHFVGRVQFVDRVYWWPQPIKPPALFFY